MPVGVRDGRCTRSPFSKLPVFDIPVLVHPPWSIKWSKCQTSAARFGRPCEYHVAGFVHPGVKVESSRRQLLVSKPSRTGSRYLGGDWDIGCRLSASKGPALGLSSPIYSRRRFGN